MSQSPNTNTGQKNGSPDSRDGGRASEALRQKADDFSRATEKVAEKAADATRDAARANSEILQRNVETAQEAMRASVETGTQSFQVLTQMMSRAFGVASPNTELAEQSARNVRAVSEASTALARGTQEAYRIWLDLVQRGVRDNLEAASELAACRSPQDLIALQSRLTRENLERAIDSGQQIAQCSTEAIGNANAAMRGVAGARPS